MKFIFTLVTVLALSPFASVDKTFAKTKMEKRSPAQASMRIRNLISCQLPSNSLEISSIEIFGDPSSEKAATDIFTIVEISAHGGFKVLYQGGELKMSIPNLDGFISIADERADFSYDGKKGTLKIHDQTIAATRCKSVLR